MAAVREWAGRMLLRAPAPLRETRPAPADQDSRVILEGLGYVIQPLDAIHFLAFASVKEIAGGPRS